MIEIINRTEHSLVEVSVIGTLTKEDFEQLGSFFEDTLTKDSYRNVLLLLDKWDGITPAGIVEDFTLLQYVKNISKAAIIADSELLYVDAEVENLYPGLQVKYFTNAERQEAESWLTN